MYVPYHTLPQNSRVWIYQSDREFTEKEQEFISNATTDFVEQWTRHGENVKGSFILVYNRFLIIAVDQDFVEVSGCSIDASVKLVQHIQAELKVDMLNKLTVAYKVNDTVVTDSLSNFTTKAKEGSIDSETIVFNNMVNTIEGVATSWEVAAKDSWHNRFVNTPSI